MWQVHAGKIVTISSNRASRRASGSASLSCVSQNGASYFQERDNPDPWAYHLVSRILPTCLVAMPFNEPFSFAGFTDSVDDNLIQGGSSTRRGGGGVGSSGEGVVDRK